MQKIKNILKTLNIKKLIFIVTLFLFVIGICSTNCAPDNDLWARLIAGKHIVEELSVLKHDFLSYTPVHNWYDHEWGASIFLYLALKYFGDAGLIYLKGILAFLTLFTCFKIVELNKPKSTTPYNILYYSVIFFALLPSLGLMTRCLLFTCLFFALFLYVLEKSRKENPKFLILLPVIMLFWANIHGGCLSGLGLIFIYIIGEFLNKKPIKAYIIALFFCFAVLFINPYGIEYVKFLFSAALMHRGLIEEWAWSFSHNFAHRFTGYKICLFVFIFVQIFYIIKNKIKWIELDKTKLLTVIAMIYLSVSHMRHQTFFMFTVPFLLYDEFYSIANSFMFYIDRKFNISARININHPVSLKNILYYILLIGISLNFLIKEKQIRITELEYPRFAIEFIKINNIKGNLFINFNWGSYAAYKLYPNNLIVMDGRYEEVYYPELLEDIKNFHLVRGDFYKIIREYKPDVMVLETKYPVYKEILNNKEWQPVFENNLSGVFVPASKVKPSYLYPVPEDSYYNKTKFDTQI